jgi:hypothetical protein
MTETYTSGTRRVKAGAEFVERIGRVRRHCEDFRPSVHELVTKVE